MWAAQAAEFLRVSQYGYLEILLDMRPTKTEEAEVVILGAGIAGLLLSSELSARHKVVLIEKQPEVRSQKYWLTDTECAKEHIELNPCIDMRYGHIDFIAYDHTSYRCAGDYILWNTERLIAHLKEKFLKQGGTILPRHTFYSYHVDKNGITIFANDGAVRAILAIDCMGYGSPIIYAKNTVDILGYYLLYGATFRAAKQIEPIGLHNMSINAKPVYIEAFPTADGHLHLILIMPESTARTVASLREEFDFVINRSPYRHAICSPASGNAFLGGIIPVGTLRRQALDRIFFFGEAGQSNPAATATALTRMLYSYKSIALHLSSNIEAGKLSAEDLTGKELSSMSRFDRKLQEALFRDILRWDSDKFLEVVKEMIRTDNHDIVNGIMFGQTSSSSVFSLGTLRDLAFRRSTNILRNLTKGWVS